MQSERLKRWSERLIEVQWLEEQIREMQTEKDQWAELYNEAAHGISLMNTYTPIIQKKMQEKQLFEQGAAAYRKAVGKKMQKYEHEINVRLFAMEMEIEDLHTSPVTRREYRIGREVGRDKDA